MMMMSEIEELKALLPGDVEDMRLLMCQLSPRLQLAAALLEQMGAYLIGTEELGDFDISPGQTALF